MNAALVAIMLALPADLAEPDQAVEAGRDALDQWWGYPWYDSASDGIRRVDVRQRRNWNWNFDLEPLLRFLAFTVLALLVAGLIYLLVRAWLRRRSMTPAVALARGQPKDDALRIEALPFAVRGGRLDLLGEARRHYQQGDYGQAIVYLFSYELVSLDKNQVIRLGKGKTNRQYLRELGLRTSLRRLLEQTMIAFEDVFFGNHRLSRDRFEACWSQVDQFHSLAAVEMR